MKIKIFLTAYSTLIIFLLFTELFFGSVSQSHAQSSQVWSEPVNLSNSGSAVDPLLVIDSVGRMHAIWVDEIEGYKYTESTDGIVWTTPKTGKFPFSPKNDSRPTFITNRNGSIHIFWRDKDNALYHVQTQSENFGNPAATAVKKLADSTLDFNAKVDSRGALHVSYVTSMGTDVNPPGIYYRRLDSAGWSATVNLYSSQYFRSLSPDSAHVRLAVSSDENTDNIYIVWDDRPQKRVFMAKSVDGGVVWNEAMQVKGPEDSAGIETPFNADISFINDDVLLLWQAGSPGERCTQYSQSSVDGGERFGEPIKLLDELVACPKSSEFIVVNKDFLVVLLNIQDDLSLIAWNNNTWSRLQSQNELSSFPNPSTFDNVIFGCQKLSYYNERLYIVGCDVENSKDIWFRSRSLGSLEEWFPPPSVWSLPISIANSNQKVSSLTSVAEGENNIHDFWVQSPLLEDADGKAAIQYARWDGSEWSNPVTVIKELIGTPLHLTAKADNRGRLIVVWVDGKTGEILFSWANANQASRSSEWSKVLPLPIPSSVNSSPDILVDAESRILIMYAVPINEERGIYFIESEDFGVTWSQPVWVFDAVSAGWDVVDQPKISLTGDGRLHMLFVQYALQGNQRRSIGLYYSQSADGGIVWSKPEMVSEQAVLWREIIGFDERILHRLWEEKRQSTLVYFHQVSLDSGVTWSVPVKISSVNTDANQVTVAMDQTGGLYFLKPSDKDGLSILVQKWDGFRWILQEPARGPNIKSSDIRVSLTANITSKGYFLTTILADYPNLTGTDDIFSMGRSLGELDGKKISLPVIISTPIPEKAPISNVGSTPTQASPLANLPDTSTSMSRRIKNIVGLLFLSGLLVFGWIIFKPNRKS